MNQQLIKAKQGLLSSTRRASTLLLLACMTLSTAWAQNTYTITYDANGGTGAPSAQTKTEGVDLTLSTTVPTRPGYRFVGWSPIDPKKAVDMGLGSGLLWATCNVGANNPEEYGDYFAWGETSPHYSVNGTDTTWLNGYSAGYTWSNYKYCQGSKSTMTKYCTDSKYGTDDNKTVLEAEDDAATANWGRGWRMPTYAEWQELVNNTESAWTMENGVYGRKFTASNGNSIFLPAAGSRDDGDFHNAGSGGDYWSASLNEYYSYYVLELNFLSNYRPPVLVNIDRSSGQSVRAVTKNDITYAAGGTYTANASITLYARWEEAYTITFDANGGEYAPQAQLQAKSEQSITLATAVPSRTGYNFLGWNTLANGNGTSYTPGATFSTNADVTLYAQWKKKIYTIAFDANGGTGTPEAQTKPHGDGLTLPTAEPTREGYKFVGWSTYNPNKAVDLGLPSKTLWATCNIGAEEPEGYGDYFAWGETTPHYSVNGTDTTWLDGYSAGYTLSNYKYCQGKFSTLTKYCNRSNYGNVDNKTMLEADDDAATTHWGYGWQMPTNDQFTELVSSDNTTTEWTTQNGVIGCLITSQKNGNSIFLPAAGTRSFAALNGMGTSSNYWSASLHGNNANNARYLAFYSGGVEEGGRARYCGLSVRAVARDVQLYAAGATLTALGNVTLYAQWEKTISTITFDANGGTGAPEPQTKTYGIDLILPTTVPVRDGYKFMGWNTLADGTGDSYAAGATCAANGNVTLYAQWEEAYTITYDANGGTGAPEAQTLAISEASVTLATTIPTRTGYTFVGWSTSADIDHDYVNLGLPTGTLWATCNLGAENPEAYGNYYAWGETKAYKEEDRSNAMNYNYEDSYIKTNFSWDTYKYCRGSKSTMTKYCTNSKSGTVDNKTVLEAEDDAVTANWGSAWRMPTIAEWEELINSNYTKTEWTTQNNVKGCKITSKSNGNSIFLPAAGYRGTSLSYAGTRGFYWSSSLYESSPEQARDLYFNSGGANSHNDNRNAGQSVRAVAITYAASATFTANGNVTLYAQWEEAYTITFDANGGEGAPEPQTKAENVDLTLSTTIPTREGYKFMGWSTVADGNGDSYAAGDTYTANAAVTLYAQWEEAYTITYDANGGEGAPEPQLQAKSEESVTLATTEPTRPGYKFVGWSTSAIAHDYVDLGLSSGLLWATCNVGANSPEEYGDYFAWGETSPHYTVNGTDTTWLAGYSAGYNWSTYKYCNGSSSTMTKYCTNSNYGTVDNIMTLELADDAANANWGGDWRMPTSAEFQELVDNCSSEWVTDYNGTGVAGRLLTSNNNGNTLFLPAAGYRDDTGLDDAGSLGYFWSSSLIEISPYGARGLGLSSRGVRAYSGVRYNGRSVRAVTKGIQTYAAGATFTATSDVTLYAQWEIDPSQWMDITLANNATNNGATVTENDGELCNVTLADRILYRDGDWNTLCLPFEVDLTNEDCPLYGAIARPLSSASLTNNGYTLTLNFDEPVTRLEAGVPYIIKWEVPADAVLDDIVNPVFNYVKIDATDGTFVSEDELVRFIGICDRETFDSECRDVLFMGGNNKLYYPDGKNVVNIGACRAYFKIGNDEFTANAVQIRSFVLDFGEEEETLSITNCQLSIDKDLWFTLDGRRLKGKPNEKGMFIHNGKTVVE
ncbi:MAG: InlB B-repeat-containing protein [Bacteroidales bacterium]|nr:InlB B-repeat-containing protein [Bacteroidales bacterium]